MKPLEVLTGTGEVFSGTELLRHTRYRLEVAASGSAPGAPPIKGTIEIQGMGEAVVLAGAPDLTLRLEDGRLLPFTLASSGGHIHARGFASPTA